MTSHKRTRPIFLYIALFVILPALAMAQTGTDGRTHSKPDPQKIFHDLLEPYQS